MALVFSLHLFRPGALRRRPQDQQQSPKSKLVPPRMTRSTMPRWFLYPSNRSLPSLPTLVFFILSKRHPASLPLLTTRKHVLLPPHLHHHVLLLIFFLSLASHHRNRLLPIFPNCSSRSPATARQRVREFFDNIECRIRRPIRPKWSYSNDRFVVETRTPGLPRGTQQDVSVIFRRLSPRVHCP